MLELLDAPWPIGEVVRAAHLLGDPGRPLLERAVYHWPPESEEARTLREALGAPELVALGKPEV